MKADAIILARAGSKGITNKNLIDFCGKPLLGWTIEQCMNATSIEKTWVSSDGDDILNFSRNLGCSTILRPKELASDTSSSEDGWLHAIEEIEKEGRKINTIIAPQPTSPLRKPDDFNLGLKKFFDNDFDSLFSCSVVEDLFFWEKDSNNFLRSINYDYKNRKLRQQNPTQYIENGSFYIFNVDMIRTKKNRFGDKIGFSTMEFWQTFEIDDLDDLRLCSAIMKQFLMKEYI